MPVLHFSDLTGLAIWMFWKVRHVMTKRNTFIAQRLVPLIANRNSLIRAKFGNGVSHALRRAWLVPAEVFPAGARG